MAHDSTRQTRENAMGNEKKEDDLKIFLEKVKNGLKITKVVCTRSVKSPRGDIFVGFSAAWNSIQDDGGQNLLETMEEDVSNQGMSLKEARAAAHLLAMQADVSAYENAVASCLISPDKAERAIRVIKSNYAKLLKDDFAKS